MLHLVLLALLILTNISSVFNEDEYQFEDAKDAHYRHNAIKCLNSIILQLFRANSFNTIVYETVEYSYPQYEIAEELIKQLNNDSSRQYWTWEVTNGTLHQFESFGICIANCTSKSAKQKFKYYNKKNRRSDNYLVILHRLEDLEDMLLNLRITDTYNANANFVVYFDKLYRNSLLPRYHVLSTLYANKNYNSFVFMPMNLDIFNLYGIQIYGKAVATCGKDPEYKHIVYCHNGKIGYSMLTKVKEMRNLNCSLNVIGMTVPPMVINKEKGVEIAILKTIAMKLNVSVNMQLHNDVGSWGTRLNGTADRNCKLNCSLWTKYLKAIDEDPFLFGVGRVTVKPERMLAFDYSLTYFMEDMLWVVPTADLIPAWASIITIFEWPTWLSLFGLVILMGVLTNGLAKCCKQREHNYLKVFSASMLASVQVLLSTAVANQPKSNPVRALFITYAMFMIIVGSLYQSGLVNVLTHPRYEHQIDSEDDVFDSGIGVGGLASRRGLFNNPDSERDMRIFHSYEVYDEVNDTTFQWLLTVAKDRDTITILGESYTRYFIDTKHPDIVDHDGLPKVHLIKTDVLYTEQVSMIFPKGFLLKEPFDHIIRILYESGLIRKWQKKFETEVHVEHVGQDEKGDDDHEDHSKGGVVVISLNHLQGAFSFLIIGLAFGLVAFVGEHVCSQIRRYYVRRRFRKIANKVKNVNRLGLITKRRMMNPHRHEQTKEVFTKSRLRFIKQKTPYF